MCLIGKTQLHAMQGNRASSRGEWEVSWVFSSYEVIDISPGILHSSLCFLQPSVSHDVLCIEVK